MSIVEFYRNCVSTTCLEQSVQDDLFHILFPLFMRQMTISNIQITLIISAVFGIGIITNAEIYNSTYVFASPTGNTITMKLTDTLQSITSNTSTSVQDCCR